MPGSMAPFKKRRNATRLPLALNPQKSKAVLSVLAERNPAVVPVGAWVEPASPHSSEIPASTSAYMIEEELKEQLRKKKEALEHFQRQVKHRVNQQISLRKKQQLQKFYEAAEKEGSIAMQSSDPAHSTSKRTSVFPNNLNAARLPHSQMLGDGIEDRENQNQLFQQAQAEPDLEESSSIMIDKKERENLICWDQQDLLSEENDKPFSRVQKVQFKNPLFAVMEEEEELQKLHLQGVQNILPETQDYLPEAQGDLLETQGDLTGVQSIELAAQNIEPHTQAFELEGQAVEPKAQVVETKNQDVMLEAQSTELEDGNMLEVQDFQFPNQALLPKHQNILPTRQDQNFLCEDQHVLPKDQHILLKFQDQHFLPRDLCVLTKDQCVFSKEQNTLPKCQDQDFLPRYQKLCFKEPYSDMMSEKERGDFALAGYPSLTPQLQDQAIVRDQSSYFRQQPPVVIAERRQDLLLGGHQYRPVSSTSIKYQREASSGRQVYDKYQSGLNTEFQTPLALQFGVDQEEDKKERQKQYLRYRRLFMDIEREQVKEEQRQKEHRKKIAKIKKKKEQQRYDEEQRMLKMHFYEEPCSGEKMSEMLAQLQLEEIKEAREKRQQRGKEWQRYIEALRVQIQEKMQLYNITLPPLCCCGPDFWDAHPDTCANNCIFYKNHRAYTRALHSVINSCDIPEGNSALRVAIHCFASAHRRTLKNV
ncbi:coiled-coil domain-containing protein 15 isoform X2 [Saccopteryx leptura]|uniref:coiled-coil domain-containing protein 15 isoform X2 n=1 Tax=Saccopteryx leptura TaxID=249018 RepID=UPI00339CF13E